ncbi:MAG: BspA family leucine-rich repeat surface protein [Methylococcales symbiont of Hymedesmia sp. n. MRB-2018]|nr:MAG: BspA family leucine-rich repeat surface protein [Methylococcales symbiont of Hymedesmia sp. n. MRB-2018]
MPDLPGVMDMSNMFRYAIAFNQAIGGWNVGMVW